MATELEKDLTILCPKCHAETGENCRGIYCADGSRTAELVCLSRRIKRLLLERRPDLLERMN